MPDIVLDFDSDDQPVLSVKGVSGPDCKSLTKNLEALLGSVTSDTPTREFDEVVKNEQRLSNKR